MAAPPAGQRPRALVHAAGRRGVRAQAQDRCCRPGQEAPGDPLPCAAPPGTHAAPAKSARSRTPPGSRQPPGVLGLARRRAQHRADLALAPRERHQRTQQALGVDPVRLGPAMAPAHRNRGRINDTALHPVRRQQAVQPEPVANGLLIEPRALGALARVQAPPGRGVDAAVLWNAIGTASARPSLSRVTLSKRAVSLQTDLQQGE